MSIAMDPWSNDLPIIWVDHENFHEAVFGRIFNDRRPNRHPLAVVHVITIEHIKETVKLANQLKCQIAIRSGGHSWAAWSVRDSSLLIDLGALESLSFDAESGIVKVAPAITAQKLDSFLSEKGRIFPGPHCPSVGLGGFLYFISQHNF